MNKLLPILLAVVLSGCAKEPIYLKCFFNDGSGPVLVTIIDDIIVVDLSINSAPTKYDITKKDKGRIYALRSGMFSDRIVYDKNFRTLKYHDLGLLTCNSP